MKTRIRISASLVFVLAVTAATAQEQPWRGSNPGRQPATQPPTLRQQPAGKPAQPRAQARAPFVLTPQEQAQVDHFLRAWEQRSDKIKTFETKFARREYDPVFGPKDGQPRFTDEGELKFKAPDKGLFLVNGERPEQWVSDGNSIFEFNHQKRQLIEHKLPPEMQGKAIEDGPLPFLFGAQAEKLKRRYWIRLLPPPRGVQNQIWLEAYPRHQQDAANFQRAELILNAQDLLPLGMQLHLPNGKSRTSYTFYGVVVNDPNPLRFLKGDPFSPKSPLGWTRVIENPPAARAAGAGAVDGRR